MVAQKQIHNILTKADSTYKAELIKQCDCDIEKIKEFEQLITNMVNISTETIGKAWSYLNEEIK